MFNYKVIEVKVLSFKVLGVLSVQLKVFAIEVSVFNVLESRLLKLKFSKTRLPA
jgi:hypothetical protein